MNINMKKRLLSLVFVLVLIALSLFFIYPIFQGELTRFPLSIESVFLAEAKFIAENFPSISWYPFWYFGLPFYLVYQPIPIFLTAFFSLLSQVPIGHSYRILTGFFLILGSVSVYLWARYLTKNRLASLVAAVSFTILPSVAYVFLNPGWRGFGLVPLRLVNTLVYGEGPHIWGLGFTPFACLFFQKLLRHPEEKLNWIGAVVFNVLVLLTSLTAFVGLLVFLFFIFWLEVSLKDFRKKFLTGLLMGFFAFGLSFFWYHPQFLGATFSYSLGDGGGIFSGYWGNVVFSFVALTTFLGGSGALYGFLSKKLRKKIFAIVLPASFFVFLFIVIYGWFAWGMALFPLPFRTIPRLIPELELAFVLLLASIVNAFPKKIGYLIAGVAIVISLLVGWSQRDKFWYITAPHQNFLETSEFVIAEKLEELGANRVYATGTHAFWLNFFINTPQLRGGKGGDFGGLNPWWAHLSYFINKGKDASLTEEWLRSLGIDYVVVNYPQSPVYYHDYRYLNRFEDFEEVFDYQGDKILKILTQNTSIAVALPKGWSDDIEKLDDLFTGEIVLDEERLDKYFSFIEEEGKSLIVEYPYGSWSQMRIRGGQLDADSEILIRQTYYRSWQARASSKKLKINPDPIGFIRIENPGEEEIVLKFRPGIDIILSGLISIIVLVSFVVFLRNNWQKRLNIMS